MSTKYLLQAGIVGIGELGIGPVPRFLAGRTVKCLVLESRFSSLS